MALVSVVIPAYNAERFLAVAIGSVLAQTHADLELVVVDDGSTDATASVASGAAAADPRVRVLRQPNGGVGAARNLGLHATAGEWVGFLDADDAWFPDKLRCQLDAFATDPGLTAVGCLMEYISEDDRPLAVAGVQIGPQEQRLVAEGRLSPFPPSAPLFRRDAVVRAGGYDTTLAGHVPGLVEDLDLLSKVARLGPVTTVPTVLGAYRLHDGSASARHYFSQRKGIRFVTALRMSESVGEPLTWERFCARERWNPWRLRGDIGAYCYRRAGLSVAERAWPRAVAHGAIAVTLAPGYSLRKLRAQRPWADARAGSSRVEPA